MEIPPVLLTFCIKHIFEQHIPPQKIHQEGVGLLFGGELGSRLHPHPGMDADKCVAAVQPAASDAHPRRIELFESHTPSKKIHPGWDGSFLAES